MAKTYEKISDTQVKVTITYESTQINFYTETLLNQLINDIDTKITTLNNEKALLQDELTVVHNTLIE